MKAAALVPGVLRRPKSDDLSVLLYHRVGVGDREIDLPVEAFEQQMAYLAGRDDVISLDEALERPDGGGIVVTFDDGFRDFCDFALPVMTRYRIPAVLYLVTGIVASGAGVQDSADAPTWPELADAVATGLVTVGAHTHSHADLSHASESLAKAEMMKSKELIEDHLGVACKHFAYPWSVASPSSERVARRIFDSSALLWKTNSRKRLDPHRLGRVPILKNDTPLFFRAKALGRLDHEAHIYRALKRGPWRRA